MEYLPVVAQVSASILGPILIAWLSIAKFRKESEKDQKTTDALGIKGLLDANAKLRDELRNDYQVIKAELARKTVENDLAWDRTRKCEINKLEMEKEINGLKVELDDIRCEFQEFKKVCETKHRQEP